MTANFRASEMGRLCMKHWFQQDGATSHTATVSIIWCGTFFQVDSCLDYETLWLPRSTEPSLLTSFFGVC